MCHQFFISLTFDVEITPGETKKKFEKVEAFDYSMPSLVVSASSQNDITQDDIHWYRNLEEKIAKAEEEIRQLQNRKRKLLNQKKDAERKARTHRLIERGAIMESLLEKPEQYSNEQIKGLLEVAFQTAQAQEHLRKIGEENGEN